MISSKSNKVESLPEKPTKKSILKMNTTSKVTKKDKMKIRKDHLQNKLKAIQMIKMEEKAALKGKAKP